jgi:hypothetical protein
VTPHDSKAARNARIAALHRNGVDPARIAGMIGLSEAMVKRILMPLVKKQAKGRNNHARRKTSDLAEPGPPTRLRAPERLAGFRCRQIPERSGGGEGSRDMPS